jgi:RNA polymerase sigma-70 factor (sigma-E family)
VPDIADFDAFVVASSPRLLRTAYLLTHNWASAEDLMQTALAKSWFAWGRVDGNPEPYVRKIIVTTHSSWWRRRWHSETPSSELPENPGVRDETRAVDDRHDLWAALGRLPARQRAVVVLRYYEDLTEAETADTLGVSVGTVKSQTAKALARLRVDATLLPALNGDDR